MTTAKELDAWSQNMTENTKKKEKKNEVNISIYFCVLHKNH